MNVARYWDWESGEVVDHESCSGVVLDAPWARREFEGRQGGDGLTGGG